MNSKLLSLEAEHAIVFANAKKFCRSVCSEENYYRSLKKGDKKKKKPANAEFELAISQAKEDLVIWTDSIVNGECSINGGASSGRKAAKDGLRTKRQVLENPDYLRKKLQEFFASVYSLEAKDEILSLYDILVRKKLRTYFSSCVIYILRQKFFFADQNNRLKKNYRSSWIQYGFVKQRGGYADLVSRLERFNFKFCGDISGWDRFFPLLEEVYTIRKDYLESGLTPEQLSILDFVIDDLLNHVVVLKNGDFYRKDIGNPSGSNNTTEDNCVGHLIIAKYLCIKVYHHYFGVFPTNAQVHEFALIYLYGDDNLGGIDTAFFQVTPQEFEEVFTKIYHQAYEDFGMPVKFLRTEYGYGPLKCINNGSDKNSVMEFLGSQPLMTLYGIIPKPDIAHLCTSLVSVMGEDTDPVLFSKLKAAWDLCYIGKDYDYECAQVCSFIKSACLLLLKDKHEYDIEHGLFMTSILLNKYQPIELTTGRESGGYTNDFGEGFVFFEPLLEGGRNKFVNLIVSSCSEEMANRNKSRGQEIALLQNKLHEEKLKLKAANARNNRSNNRNEGPGFSDNQCAELEKQMVMAIINPESVSGFRYPDMYTEGTSCYQAINNFFVPMKVSTTPAIENYPDGSYYVEIHPEIEDSVRYLREVDTSEVTPVTGYMSGDYGINSNVYGFYSGEGVRQSSTINVVASPKSYHVVLPMTSDSGVPQTPIWNSGSGEPGYYYPPGKRTEAANNINSRGLVSFIVGGFNGAIDATWELRQTDRLGNVMGSGSGTFTSSGFRTATIELFTVVDGPRDLLGWKLELIVLTTLATPGLSLTLNLAYMSVTYLADVIMYDAEPLPDLNQLKTDVEKFRVTAQSGLFTYYGSTLTNGGFATAILYRGGVPPQMAGLYDYSSISEHPASYDGPLRDGTYGYWEGMDSTDYSFRTVQSAQLYKRPFLIHTGTYAGDPSTGTIDQPNIIRGRVITQIEFTSRSQIYDVKPSPACILGLQEAMRVIAGVPNVMENGKHLAKLRRIASKAGKTLKSLGRFAWAHRAEIKQIAAAVTPILSAI